MGDHVRTKSTDPPTLKFPTDDGFHRDLKRDVDVYFEQTGKSRHANAAMIVKTMVLLTWFVATYALLVFVAVAVWQVIVLCASLALATAGIGFGIQHDANHGAYTKSAGWNRALGLTLDMLGASSFLWRVKHNIAHHTYTNVDGADDDMDIGCLARLAPEQKRHRLHSLQHVYLWGLYGFLLLKWHLAYDFKNLARGRVARIRFSRPRGLDLVELIVGKLVFIAIAFVVPAIAHPFWAVIACYAGVTFATSVLMAVVFQLAHCVEGAAFGAATDTTGKLPQAWAEHQVLSTVDFARHNRLLTWYVGGLNLQIEHHLFPKVCHVHYPALADIVRRVCDARGVRYREQSSLCGALASHWSWLRRMGRAPTASELVPAVVS